MKSADWILFQQLFHSQVEAVFRYQLICAGDWCAAQASTTEIFHTALTWFSPRLAQNEALVPWLWKIARDNQSRRSIQHKASDKFCMVEVPQIQMRSFACAAQVSSDWKLLPRRVTEPMGLFYFGRLEIQQVAVHTHLSSEEVKRTILQYGSELLSDLSSDLYPVGLFTQKLEEELEKKFLEGKHFRFSLIYWIHTQNGRYGIHCLEWSSRLVILTIFIGLTLAAWRSFSSTKSYIEESPPPPASNTALPPSYSIRPIQDNIIVADELGQIGLLQLEIGALIDPISGFRYYPCANPTRKAANPPNNSPGVPARCNPNVIPKPRYPAQFSPDGRWLSITRPIEKDSWILPLDGLGSALKISESEAHTHWAPDGHAVAFVDPLDPGNLVIYEPKDKKSVSFPCLEKGQWLSLAWSPDSKWLVAVYIRIDVNQRIYFTRIEPNKSKWEPLAEVVLTPVYRLRDFYFAFRADGKELLLPSIGKGLFFDGGNAVRLVQEPALSHTPESVLGHGLDHWYLSPDGKMIAMVETTIGTPKPCLCTLHWYQIGPGQSWLTYVGQIDALAWTSYSSSLIVQTPSSTGPILIQIDAKTGRSQKIADNLLLLGVQNLGQIESTLLLNPP